MLKANRQCKKGPQVYPPPSPPLSTLVDIVVVHMMRPPGPSISTESIQKPNSSDRLGTYIYVYDVCALVCMVCVCVCVCLCA